jgi:hypothetical protein
MGEVLPLPHRGETFLDPRGEGRSIRISGHRGAATVVLSIWQHGECRATFRLGGAEVDGFIRALLAAAPPPAPSELKSVVTGGDEKQDPQAQAEDHAVPVTTVRPAVAGDPEPPAEPDTAPDAADSADTPQPPDPAGPAPAGNEPAAAPAVRPVLDPGIESTG